MKNDKRTATATTPRNRRAIATAPDMGTTVVPVAEPVAVAVAEPEPVVADRVAERVAVAMVGASPATTAYVTTLARAFAVVAPMPVATLADRVAVRHTIDTMLHAAYPGAATATVGKNTGRFSGLHVFESQNTAYVAAAMSGAYVTDGHFVAAWSADVPTARCAYMTTAFEKSYPTSTLSAYMRGDHNGVPGFPGARDVVAVWYAANRNRPAKTATATATTA